VLRAYRAGWAAFEQAQQTANAYSPALPMTMLDPQLQLVRRNLLANAHAGIVSKGSAQLHPHTPSIQDDHATVLDCTFDATQLVYSATGKPVPPETPPQRAAVRSDLVQASPGVWKVSNQSVTEGSCPPGY
jgi:hypothetical protein